MNAAYSFAVSDEFCWLRPVHQDVILLRSRVPRSDFARLHLTPCIGECKTDSTEPACRLMLLGSCRSSDAMCSGHQNSWKSCGFCLTCAGVSIIKRESYVWCLHFLARGFRAALHDSAQACSGVPSMSLDTPNPAIYPCLGHQGGCERERERERFTTSIQPAWLMRTDCVHV